MNLAGLLNAYQQDRRTQNITKTFGQQKFARFHLKSLIESARAFVAAAVYLTQPKTHIFILEDKEIAAYFQNDLKNLLQHKKILFFPDSFKKPGNIAEINKSNVLLRTETISYLLNSQTQDELIVTYPHALFEKVVSNKALAKSTLDITVDEELDIDFILEMLVEYGFTGSDFVYEPGQFSIRGGIIDIFSFGNDLPYRIELFGDEVDSIRIFDPLSQLSTQKVDKVQIIPNIQTQFDSGDKVSLFRLLPKNACIWMADTEDLLHITQKCYEKSLQAAQVLLSENDTLELEEESLFFKDDAHTAFVDAKELLQDLLPFSTIEIGRPKPYFVQNSVSINYNIKPQPSFKKNFHHLIDSFRENEQEGITNMLFASNDRQIKRFRNIFEDIEANVKYHPLSQSLHKGFIDEYLKIACYTDHQIFERYHKFHIKQAYSKNKAMTVKLLRDLKPNDYVTHIDHGVGRFTGLHKIELAGKMQEVMRIIYKDNDVLFVNINSLHKVSKYIGKDGKVPKINKLGSDAWAAVKRKTKRKIKEIAIDLIKLYAKRKNTKGFAFSPDTYLQTEVEASFMYEDTPDQFKATQDVKADMERAAPMDRLICGDVGFGKTEIALRAATKAVADNKQVAILVPTTILALQHYKTFSNRLEDFPANIDYLNRFKTTKQKRITLEQLAAGKVDILIGTHALLGKSVKFKDLGLLVVDEEQKFGVAAKEKLRELRANVDTLILTATPIPRTLQFSLMSARDLSVINTPPPNRQPVETDLIRFEEIKIRDAINYEVYRGGQAFFIHNRVKDLVEIAAMIKRLCPDVEVGMAHGQMENKELERRMLRFIDGKYDVLVCTNIVESGLDISNANTIIINNAHHFGLSDLHQLRGRVGRSNKKAFCYLISPPLHSLPDTSRKRLRAIEQFSDLGSGFQVAMRDLDIRGAGNLLGAEQSGFISDIGFDMYHKILDEAIQELRETEFEEVFKGQSTGQVKFVRDCQIDTDLEILIPDEYVNNQNERLRLYTELDNIEEEKSLEKFKKGLRDRFGPLPMPVKELFNIVRLRWSAKKLGFERIILKKNKLRAYFVSNHSSPFYQSATFQNLLKYVQIQARKRNDQGNIPYFKQSNKHFLLVFDNVKRMKTARALLKELVEKVVAFK